MKPKNAEELEADLWRRTMERHDITREQIRAVLSALRDAGVALVPREPTENMGVNGYEAIDWSDGPHSCADAYNRACAIYRAILAASPYEEG